MSVILGHLQSLNRYFNPRKDSVISERKVKAKGHIYKQIYIFIPRDVANDSQFPFKTGDKIKVRIQDDQLIIWKA